jgi:hypothetical protein
MSTVYSDDCCYEMAYLDDGSSAGGKVKKKCDSFTVYMLSLISLQ